jgi:hypothetical protein
MGKSYVAPLARAGMKLAKSGKWVRYKDIEQRISELEAELEANQQSWQEHDQGRIFAAKAMQLRIAELEGVIYRNCDSAQATDSDAKIIDEICINIRGYQKEWRPCGG